MPPDGELSNKAMPAVTDSSALRNDLEANQRRTYPDLSPPSDFQESSQSGVPDYNIHKGEMKYGAIKEFQVVPVDTGMRDSHTIYGLGYDGGMYIWDRERKAWALVNR